MASEDKVVVQQLIPATCDEVFDAWLDTEAMAHWMCPGNISRAEVALDARVGGRFRIVMHYADPTQASIEHTGEFREITRPSKLVFTWHSPATEFLPSLVTVEFRPDGNECVVTLVHENFPRIDKVPGHQKGWTDILGKLALQMERRRGARA